MEFLSFRFITTARTRTTSRSEFRNRGTIATRNADFRRSIEEEIIIKVQRAGARRGLFIKSPRQTAIFSR